MSFITRYSSITRGGISFIGNTLGLSKGSNANIPGVLGSIGAFTSLGNTQVSTFPVGTTLNYLLNGSNAILSLPAGSAVLYAELVWGGLYQSAINNISALIDNAVTFNTPLGSSSISPDAITSQNFLIPGDGGTTLGFYVRSANVTNLVSAATNGTYSVQAVPALIEPIDANTSDTNHGGWTLCVVYGNINNSIRNLTLWVGGVPVGPNTPVADVALSGFITPSTLPVTAKVFLSAQEGDAVLTGDQFLFGQNTSSLVAISGPNNPIDNFFASQINDENGAIVTTGTFGMRNADAAAGTNTSACRQGWDITAVDVSSQMQANQSSAVFRFTSSGDLYVPNALAAQIDAQGAFLTGTKSANKNVAVVGEIIDYTISVTNVGQIEAIDVLVDDFIPEGLSLVPNSIFVDGIGQSDSFPVTIAQIASNQTVTLTYSLVANAMPQINPAINTASITYTFFAFEGFPITVNLLTNPANILFISTSASDVKTVDKMVAQNGDILTYASTITNTGTLTMQNVEFVDAIPMGTVFVGGSVMIDGVSEPLFNPSVGFLLADILAGESVIVKFKVQVTTNYNTTITNQSNTTYVSILPDESSVTTTIFSNIVTTRVESNQPVIIEETDCACKKRCCNKCCRWCNKSCCQNNCDKTNHHFKCLM